MKAFYIFRVFITGVDELEVKEKVVLSLPLPLQLGLGYNVTTEKSS